MHLHTCNEQTNKYINVIKIRFSYGHMVHKKFIMKRIQKFSELEHTDVFITKGIVREWDEILGAIPLILGCLNRCILFPNSPSCIQER